MGLFVGEKLPKGTIIEEALVDVQHVWGAISMCGQCNQEIIAALGILSFIPFYWNWIKDKIQKMYRRFH
jgi:hypothetical protein